MRTHDRPPLRRCVTLSGKFLPVYRAATARADQCNGTECPAAASRVGRRGCRYHRRPAAECGRPGRRFHRRSQFLSRTHSLAAHVHGASTGAVSNSALPSGRVRVREQSSSQEVVIALNMDAHAREAALDALSGSEWRVLLSSRRGTAEPIDVNRLHLGAFEALLMERVSDV